MIPPTAGDDVNRHNRSENSQSFHPFLPEQYENAYKAAHSLSLTIHCRHFRSVLVPSTKAGKIHPRLPTHKTGSSNYYFSRFFFFAVLALAYRALESKIDAMQ